MKRIFQDVDKQRSPEKFSNKQKEKKQTEDLSLQLSQKKKKKKKKNIPWVNLTTETFVCESPKSIKSTWQGPT